MATQRTTQKQEASQPVHVATQLAALDWLSYTNYVQTIKNTRQRSGVMHIKTGRKLAPVQQCTTTVVMTSRGPSSGFGAMLSTEPPSHDSCVSAYIIYICFTVASMCTKMKNREQQEWYHWIATQMSGSLILRCSFARSW